MLRFRSLLLALSWLLAGPALAQVPTPDWLRAQVLDTPGQSTAEGLLADAAGNAYLTGVFTETLTLAPGATLTATGLLDSYVAKYSPTGSLLWRHHLAGASYTVAHDLVRDAAGNLYVGGSFVQRMSLGGLTLSNAQGNTYLFLAKLDPQGQVQWLRQLGGGGFGLVSGGLGVDAAGNAYFTGNFIDEVTLGGTTLRFTPAPGSFQSEVYLAKFDPQGQLVWARQGGREDVPGASSPYYQYAPRLTVSPAGACYLHWSSTPGMGGFGPLAMPAGHGSTDALVVKFDPQGTPAWIVNEGGPGIDGLNRAALDGTGQLLVTGAFQGRATFGTYPLYSPNGGGLLLSLDEATGRVRWAQQLAATTGFFGPALTGLTVDAAGNSYVAALLDGDGHVDGVSFLSAGGRDGLVLSFTPQGGFRWAQQADGAGDELPGHLALLPNGELLVAGNLHAAGRFGPHAVASNPVSAQDPARYFTNAFVAKLGQLPTGTRPAQAAALAVYPNPVAQGEAMQLPALPGGTRVSLSDALGRRVWQGAAASTLAVPAALAPGAYLLLATAPDGRQWRSRLLVE